ncbi:MAG: pantetheine-phosphate adenylyltransferase [candidate division WOR-3 bacterium]
MKKAVYPGSFDPITNGHLDIVERAVQLFDQVLVGVAVRAEKNPLFTVEERVRLAQESLASFPSVKVTSFNDLLVDFVRREQARTVIRGLRAVLDFDYEFQMVLTNRKIAPEIETVFFLPSEKYFYLSSTLVKEIARLGGPLACFVPEPVRAALHQRYAGCRPGS